MGVDHLNRTKLEFNRVANEQEHKGVMKYGKALDPLEHGRDWIEMAKQEQVDGFKYQEAELVKREFVIEKIRKRTNDVEINHWLDMLEGK